jgi:hypothetical protein
MDKVKIGGVTYSIEEVNDLRDVEYLGYVNYGTALIRVDGNLAHDRKKQVLAHEIMHAIFYEAGYQEQDEEMVERLGIVLHQFLRDNDLRDFHPAKEFTATFTISSGEPNIEPIVDDIKSEADEDE